MEETLFNKFVESVISGGPVAMLMALGLWYFKKSSETLVNQLQAERTGRMDAMDKEITRQRARNDECEADRRNLYHIIGQMQRGQFPAMEYPQVMPGAHQTNQHLSPRID